VARGDEGLLVGLAICATDILLRRNRYDGRALSDQIRTGPFWYTAGGTDLSLPVGLLVSAGVYLLLMRHLVRV
jgi:hypothetical protein